VRSAGQAGLGRGRKHLLSLLGWQKEVGEEFRAYFALYAGTFTKKMKFGRVEFAKKYSLHETRKNSIFCVILPQI
jgi:hypothetical protein